MLVQRETGEWDFDWPVRGDEEPSDEQRELRKDWNAGLERVNVISPWSFSYPTRLMRKERTDG